MSRWAIWRTWFFASSGSSFQDVEPDDDITGEILDRLH
jgi:hypothetical protein